MQEPRQKIKVVYFSQVVSYARFLSAGISSLRHMMLFNNYLTKTGCLTDHILCVFQR